MSDETTVTAADIARLAAVGRAAVSNWRRRYPDFPQPVGGTPASPLFALAEIEAWLRSQGKLLELPLAERAWQELRARAGAGLHLGGALADLGELLAGGRPGVPPAIRELAAACGPEEAFEVLLRRFQEAQARRAAATPPDIADLMAELVAGARTVLDPACGAGDLLLAARDRGARRLLGQDAAAETARLASIRLRLAGGDADVRAGDSLRSDAFPGELADAVLCDPPFHERGWGHEELSADPRWHYGLPPRLEPELAWVQHVLAHLAPGGLAVMLMPAAAAARKPGRRIRAQLLRRGALRGVVALSAAHHLWLLHQPAGELPASVLMVSSADPQLIAAAWRQAGEDTPPGQPGVSRAAPVIEFLDDEVDLTPARHLPVLAPADIGGQAVRARAALAAAAGGLDGLIPRFRAASPARAPATVPLSELARTGVLTIHLSPARGDAEPGDEPVITAGDVTEGRPASGRAAPAERWLRLQPGDVVVAAAGGRLVARALENEGGLLGPGLALLRPDPQQLDPFFLAGVLGSSANAQVPVSASGVTGGRSDLRRVRIPQLPLAQQRRYGEAFQRLTRLTAAARRAVDSSSELARLLADGATEGALEPADGPPPVPAAGPLPEPPAGSPPAPVSR